MQQNIVDFFAYEVKKEMADRYFGFRKLIEEDKLSLQEKIKQHSFILEKRICFDLIRIYLLFGSESLSRSFVELSGWQEMLYYDPYLPESRQVRERVFKNIRPRGLTRSGRFKNLVLDAYDRLVAHVGIYREKLEELEHLHAVINSEIDLFYKKNDLSNIMSFLRNLDEPVFSTGMDIGPQKGFSESIEDKMRIQPCPPIDQLLPFIPPLTPLNTIRSGLKKLIDQAYKQHGREYMLILHELRENEMKEQRE